MTLEFIAGKVRQHRKTITLDWNKHSTDPLLPYYVRWDDPSENRVLISEEDYRYLKRIHAAATLGAMSSPMKAKAARENGKKGGRPGTQSAAF